MEECGLRDDFKNSQNVLVAFDVLIEEIEEALRRIHAAGTSALETRNYDMAQTMIDHARNMMKVCEKVSTLKREWKDIEAAFSVDRDAKKKTLSLASLQPQMSMDTAPLHRRPVVHQTLPYPTERLIAGRISKGLRTPESVFFQPILQTLSDLGGAAKRSDVFNVLESSMRNVLQPIDYQTLSSESEPVRWQNSAQWARNLMVKEGLLKSDSLVGTWEMTEKVAHFFGKKVAEARA